MRDPRVDKLAREITGLHRKFEGLSLSPRLTRASIEDGTVHEFDRDGNLVGTIGKQHDGTHGAVKLNGPLPPTPTAPTLDGGPNALTISWDGRYVDPEQRAPLDFKVVEVYVSIQPFTQPSEALLAGAFPDEAGGQMTLARPAGTWHVALVTKSEPGRRSLMSEVVTAETTSILDQEALDNVTAAVEDLEQAVAELGEVPEDLAQRLADLRTDLDAASTAVDGATAMLNEAFPGGAFSVEQRLANTLKSSVVEYAVGPSETEPPASGWSTATPTRTPGTFIWFRTLLTYGDDSTTTTNPALLTGNAGEPGDPGDPGRGITGTTVTYAQSTSGTTPPTSGWQAAPPAAVAGRYVWTRTVWTYSDGTTETGYSVGKIGETGQQGDPGSPGAPGVSITAITPYYRQQTAGTAAPVKPTTSTVPPTGWSATEPAFAANSELYRTERVDFSNGTFSYTTVVKVASYAGIDAAMAAANGKNLSTYADIARGATIPNPPAVAGRAVGDTHRVRYSDNGEIAKEWALRAGSPNTWQEVKFGDAIMTSLDVGKLSAGTGVFDTAVAEFMAGEMAVFVKAVIDDLIVNGTLQVNEQVAEMIWAAKMAVRKVLAQEVILGGFWNVLSDVTFDPKLWSGSGAQEAEGTGYSGGYSQLMPSGTTQRGGYLGLTNDGRGALIEVEPGQVYRGRVWVRANTNVSVGDIRIYARTMPTRDASTQTTSLVGSNKAVIPANTWTMVEDTITIPAGMQYLAFGLFVQGAYTGAVRFSDPALSLMVTNNLVVDGGIVGRHLNVVEELPNGAKFSVQPDGIRIWAAGNTTTRPNVLMTLTDGFRIQKNDGTALLWLDATTGNIHTAGAIFAGGEITGSKFSGGEIDIKTPLGAPILRAAPNSGVTVGGQVSVYTGSTSSTTNTLTWPAAGQIPVEPGALLRLRFGFRRSTVVADQTFQILVRFYLSGGAYLSGELLLGAYRPGTTVESHDFVARVPTGAAHARLYVVRNGTQSGTYYISDFSVDLLGPGDLAVSGQVAGDVAAFREASASRGRFGPLTIRDSGTFHTFTEPLEIARVIDMELPPPITLTGALVNNITSSTWANLPGGNVTQGITLPAPAWVDVRVGGTLIAFQYGDVRFGAECYGATVMAPEDPSWGFVPWLDNLNTNRMIVSAQSSVAVLLNAGLTTFRLRAQNRGTGVAQVNYPTLQLVPLRWAFGV